uniref:Tudor domain-containing protein n=1 Tax=Angiostrongylus cantonensis TaxID=6313 RepID=A0A0K0D888_ANGCA
MKDLLAPSRFTRRSAGLQETMNVLSTKHTLLGDVTIAPRWLGDVIGRTCIFKRVLISYESYGDLLHGYGTVTKVLPYSIIVKSESDGEFIWCSLLSVCPWLKVPFNVGEYVRYTACLNMPNSEYKWRCLRIGRTSRINMNNYKNLTPIKAQSSQCILDENAEQSSKQVADEITFFF